MWIETDVGTVMIVIFVTEIVNAKDLDLERGIKNVPEVVQEIVVLTEDPGADLVIGSVIVIGIAGTRNPIILEMAFCLP